MPIRPPLTGASAEITAYLSVATEGVSQGLNKVAREFGNTQRIIMGMIGAISFGTIIHQISNLVAEAVKFERVGQGFRSLTLAFGMNADKI